MRTNWNIFGCPSHFYNLISYTFPSFGQWPNTNKTNDILICISESFLVPCLLFYYIYPTCWKHLCHSTKCCKPRVTEDVALRPCQVMICNILWQSPHCPAIKWESSQFYVSNCITCCHCSKGMLRVTNMCSRRAFQAWILGAQSGSYSFHCLTGSDSFWLILFRC